jgi:hypothetical protein
LQIAFFGIGVALDPVNPEGQIRGDDGTSLTRGKTGNDGREQFMIIGGFGFYQLLALILIMVAAWTAKKPIAAFFKSYPTSRAFTHNLLAARWLAPKPILAQKNCPHCAVPMPISALFCDACDYNYLSGSLGTRQKSLPAPASMKRKVSKPHLVSSRL